MLASAYSPHHRSPPNVYFRLKKEGGIKFNTTVPLTKLGDDPAYAVKRMLAEYKMHNCELLLREVSCTDRHSALTRLRSSVVLR
jgi:uncharacterized protein